MLRDQDYLDRLTGVATENRKAKVRTEVSVDESDEVIDQLIGAASQLEAQGIEFVQLASSQRTATPRPVNVTRYGIAIGILDGQFVIGNVKDLTSGIIVGTKFFDLDECWKKIANHIRSRETSRKIEMTQHFEEALQHVARRGVIGKFDAQKLVFETQMGATVSVITWFQGIRGLWARIKSKQGQITHRSLFKTYRQDGNEPFVPSNDDHIYHRMFANIIRKHELTELGKPSRKRVDYKRCGHRDQKYPKEVHHNCGCTEVTSLRRRK